jgi:Tat protein translocase TatB subunit
MEFFGVGAGELLLILVLALIIWGPGKLPEIARTLGRATRVLKKATRDFTAEVTKEIDREEKARPSQPRQNSEDKSRESSAIGKTQS